jgi:DNA-binding transcriptional ArsR family regulator/rhodanese-related sulfurtransferase
MNSLNHRRFKDDLYTEFARIGTALSSPKRLEIIDLLAQRERSVDELAREMGLSIANASQHLRALAAAKLVTARRAGTYAHYRLAGPGVFSLFRSLRDAASEQLPEVAAVVRRDLGEQRNVVLLRRPADIAAHVRAKRAVMLDVRPRTEYAAGHLPGAISIPVDGIARRSSLRSLPRRREIVVYCRGPYCVWADEAVDVLRRRGFSARRLLIGPPDWEALGGHSETASAKAG